MGITGLLPFIEKASRRANISEFSGSTVAIDSYCWLHKGAFSCADKLVRGEDTDAYINYCLKYVTMLLSKNIKPILVFDGRHLPAKALTETKRRESRDISKKRAAELLRLGKIDEARLYMRKSVDITHKMALGLIKECRKRNVDCIVAPYEADSQLAYLNVNNIAQLVITEDSDLMLFGCTKVLYKMDLEGTGTLVESAKLALTMKCPIERYSFDKFRKMCILSGCDYLPSLHGIGLAKARDFVTATQDPDFANALRKLPSYLNKPNLVVTDEYRENFLKAEATFKHQYVYDPIGRKMCRLQDPDDSDVEIALCSNAGELLEPEIAFQLALGNLDPFTLKVMDNWHPDINTINRDNIKTNGWKEQAIADHPSIWRPGFKQYLTQTTPWKKEEIKVEQIINTTTRPRKKVVNLVTKFVPETQDEDESLSIQTLSNMYCIEPANKKQKVDDEDSIEILQSNEIKIEKSTSPILENKGRSFRKRLKNESYSVLKQLSRFPRTILDDNVIESRFFSSEDPGTSQESQKSQNTIESTLIESSNDSAINSEELEISQKENSALPSPDKSPIFNSRRNPFKIQADSQDSVIESTYPSEELVTPVDSQESIGESPPKSQLSQFINMNKCSIVIKNTKKPAKVLKKSVQPNQPTLLSKFGFQKKPVLRR